MIVDNDQENIKSIPDGRILGIDYGKKRIGLAVSDPFQLASSTYKTVHNKNRSSVVNELHHIIKEENIQAVVVGQPLHMNGDVGEMAEQVQAFVLALDEGGTVPIFLWDERWTTASAEKLLIESGKSPSKNRHKIDQLAAAFLLQSFLDRISFLKRQE